MPAVHALLAIACLAFSLTAQVERFGRSCSSPGTASSAGRAPRVNVDAVPTKSARGFTYQIDTGVPYSAFLMVFGISTQSWAGGSLPQDLSFLGMPGCNLWTSVDALFGFGTGVSGQLSIPVSAGPLGVGQKGFTQVISFGQRNGQNVYGVSDALTLEITAPVANHNIAVLPDTQIYTITTYLFPTFLAQTNWIVQRLKTLNIAFVSHVGDIVQYGATGTNKNKVQWDRGDLAMGKLDGDLTKVKDGLVPYGACLGNHDLDVVDNTAKATQFVSYFGPSRYSGRSWYLGSTTDGRNHAQLFKVGGLEYINLSIEWRPQDSVLKWAQELIATRPRTPVLLTTHEYLPPGNPAKLGRGGHTPTTGGHNSGDDIFGKLVEPSPQIFAVVCGHLAGEGRLTSRTALGRDVHQMLANYQFDPNGGNGWMRLLEIQPAQNRIRVSTTSPVYVPGTTTGRDYSKRTDSNFDLTYDAYEHRAFLGGHHVLRFRNGQNFGAGTYSGTQDNMISSVFPSQAGGGALDLRCDTDSNKEQGLLRFDNLVGGSVGQIPPGARIKKAVVTLTTEGTSAESTNGGKLYRMSRTWSESSTHTTLQNGIQIGTDTLAAADFDSAGKVSATSTRSFDVTAAVQAWVDGSQPNHGWAVIANGTDSWSFRSSEWGTVTERPMLTVIY